MTTATPMAKNEFWAFMVAPAVGGVVGAPVLEAVGTGGRPVAVVGVPVQFAEGIGDPETVEEMGYGAEQGGTTTVVLP